MAPEYAYDGVFSIKSDIFSFGILLLEIMSGMKNRGISYPNQSLNLIGHVSNQDPNYIYVLFHFFFKFEHHESTFVLYYCRFGGCGRTT